MDKSNLPEWNEAQRQLWLELVQEGVVKRRDHETFYLFGEIFEWYEDHFHTCPTFKEMVLFLGLIWNRRNGKLFLCDSQTPAICPFLRIGTELASK